MYPQFQNSQEFALDSGVIFEQTILMEYHALIDIFEKAAKFEIVVCCK